MREVWPRASREQLEDTDRIIEVGLFVFQV